MPANALVQARIDPSVKDKAAAAAVLAADGLTLSGFMRLTLTKIAREGALSFDPLIPNAETVEAMKEARPGKLPSFATAEALMAELNAPD